MGYIYNDELGDELARMREAGATNAQLADHAGCSKGTIGVWMSYYPEFGRKMRAALLRRRVRAGHKKGPTAGPRRNRATYIPPVQEIEVAEWHEGLMRVGDWSRPCSSCGKRDAPFRATRRGRKLYRQAACDDCRGVVRGEFRFKPRNGHGYHPPGDVQVRGGKAEDIRAGDWSRPCSTCGQTQETWFNTFVRDGLQYRHSSCRLCARAERYGMDGSDLVGMVDRQGGVCAVCGDALNIEKHAHIDHCHDSGRIRGVLCSLCNMGLGKFRDDPERLRRAADYLERDQNGTTPKSGERPRSGGGADGEEKQAEAQGEGRHDFSDA